MPQLPPDLLASCQGKNLIFTVTTGRSGSGYLQGLMGTIDDVTSLHEAVPNFMQVMRFAQSDRRFAYHFLVKQKLPAIAMCGTSVFFESSHLFCKGFMEPLLALGIVPNLIVLRREPRKVALSLLRLGTVPGRTWLGMQYLVCPDDVGTLPLPGWQSLSDYQLCYWYCLEIERRARLYTSLVRRLDGAVVETSIEQLSSQSTFFAMLDALHIPFSPELVSGRYVQASKCPRNTRPNEKLKIQLTDDQLTGEEAEVNKRVWDFDPSLVLGA